MEKKKSINQNIWFKNVLIILNTFGFIYKDLNIIFGTIFNGFSSTTNSNNNHANYRYILNNYLCQYAMNI